MILKLITVPNPLLRQKSVPITKVDADLLQFLNDLSETLLKKSDPQVLDFLPCKLVN